MGSVTGNRWWIFLRDFASKCGRPLNLDRTRKAKSIEHRLSQAVAEGDSLTVELAWRDLERETSECYKGFEVRSRLKRVLNKAVKLNATVHGEEVRRFLGWYIDYVKFSDGCVLRANHEICDAFRAYFHDRFACCPYLLLQEFCSYLTNFPLLGAAEAASCEGVITECTIHDVLKQVGLNKSPGLDGLP